ncbi:unnamed protein product [Somion occarium]|uniref:Uncharacterized protein n=1 Tax=Somion occarium TaxID=3059160 RepID=A0ABP1D211_9APHY
MPKPTLLQTLFNQPSQSYQFPPEKHYYSTKHDIQRRASHGHFSPAISPSSAPLSSSASLRHSVLSHSALDDSLYSSRSSSHSDVRTASLIPPDPVNVRASTHTRSASLSIASSHSLSIQPSSSSHFIAQGSASKPSFDSHFDSSDMNFRFPAPPIPEDDTDDDHTDIFYTPRSSLYSSPRTSRASSSALTEPKVTFHNQSVPKPNASSSNGVPPLSPSISRSSSATSASSSSSDLGSLLSTTTQATTSTRPTSPLNSDHSNKEPRSANGDVQTITVSKSHHNAEASSSRSKLNTRPRGVPATAGHRRTRSQAENGRFASTDRDWAENVRWLSANTPAVSSSQRKTKKLQGQREAIAPSTNIRRNASSSIAPSYPPLAKSAELRERARNSRGSRGSRGRGRMSALLEEDESDISEPTSGASSSEHSRPPSPAPQLPPVDQNKVTTTKVTIIPTPTPDPSTEPVMRRRSVSAHSRSDSQQNRFGTVLTAEPEELDELTDLDHPDARLRAYARSNENQRKSYRRLSRSLSLTQADPRAYASTLPTHSLPTPTSPSSTPASGYTSLTLPHATPSSSNKRRPPDSGKVDLPRSGAAQSSMATIEIIRGAAYVQTSTSNSAGREKRRRHLSFSLKFFDASKKLRSRSKEKESATPAYLLDALPLPVAFTAHLSPPTYVPASHVLVKVFAVGLDSLDSLLVKHKLDVSGGSGKASKAVGYIPGRSLVGRVVQCGWDVSSDVCRKSDWVIALLDIRKSGALSEFVVVERHRLHRAPQPQFLAQPIPTPHRRYEFFGHRRTRFAPAMRFACSSCSTHIQ